jgi:uncharacterized membrane protein
LTMAGLATDRTVPKPLIPDGYERLLAIGAIVLLGCVAAAVIRGQAEWGRVPAIVWAHLATIVIALALTPVILLQRRGTQRHRTLGKIWAGSMILTAGLSLFVRLSNHGHFSLIHLLSVFTLVQVPVIVWSARTHRVARHRSAVRAMVTGALLIAGFFTFPFGRLLGHWLMG